MKTADITLVLDQLRYTWTGSDMPDGELKAWKSRLLELDLTRACDVLELMVSQGQHFRPSLAEFVAAYRRVGNLEHLAEDTAERVGRSSETTTAASAIGEVLAKSARNGLSDESKFYIACAKARLRGEDDPPVPQHLARYVSVPPRAAVKEDA